MDNLNQKLTLPLLFFLLISKLQTFARGQDPQVPCYFIFGDSLSDAGNNNILMTLAKSNYPPYGIDFPTGATGRFCNGRTVVDILTERLGFKQFIPPFSKAIGRQLLEGVNYASAGAGIRQETGKTQGQRIWLAKQLAHHSNIVNRIKLVTGDDKSASDHLSKCLYSVSIGSNDYINNYYMPKLFVSSHIYSPGQFADLLVQELATNLKVLHSFGAKKVAIFGLSGVGCAPNMVQKFGGDPVCSSKIDNEIELFNDRLVVMVKQLNEDLANAKFTFVNVTQIFVEHLPQLATLNLTGSCCRRMKPGTCKPFSTPCENRSHYEFFDGFHPTESMNRLIGERIFTSESSVDIAPYSLKQLIAA